MNAQEQAKEYLSIASEFKLGHLETEGFHPKSAHLSSMVQTDLQSGLKILETIDHDALEKMLKAQDKMWSLYNSIQSVLKTGGKVFLCGCGATGRLSLTLETLYRQKFSHSNNVFSFMAGGDFALIKSVESFEDQTQYGERQLLELGFTENDLLISCTEGGETPFVIGATQLASKISRIHPYFLYCNPDELLEPIKRSKEILENSKIQKINLSVGPMAISGSTRMQASTVLMFSVGICLLYKYSSSDDFDFFFKQSLQILENISYEKLAPLTKFEAEAYLGDNYLNYLTTKELAISVLTDTTERSPTFSLKGFENRNELRLDHSLSYLFIDQTIDSSEAWEAMLKRSPRALEWSDLTVDIGLKKVLGFDISLAGLKKRASEIPTKLIRIEEEGNALKFSFDKNVIQFEVPEDILQKHLILKMLLNAHSTAIMGILGRYEGNVMTFVRPSNNKLIDRAARYALQILKRRGKIVSYEEIVEKIFELQEKIEDRPIVLRVVDSF